MSPKQEQFVHEYMVDLNATQAAIRAGYSKKRASEIAYQLLQKTTVQAAIRVERLKTEKRTDITIDRCLQEYAKIAFLDPSQMFEDNGTLKNIQDMPEDTKRAIAGMEVINLPNLGGIPDHLKKIKISDKKGALDSIMRHLGGFDDRMKIDLGDGVKKILSVLPSDFQEQVLTKLSQMNKAKK